VWTDSRGCIITPVLDHLYRYSTKRLLYSSAVDLSLSPAAQELREQLDRFLDEHVYPAEAEYAASRRAAGPGDHTVPPVVVRLTRIARSLGLWNLFLPAVSGLTNAEYAQLAELAGRSPYLAPQAMNCAAPDTGNMELLHMFGTPEQKERWLAPLLDGRIRSGFSMTEPTLPPPMLATSGRRSSVTATATSLTGGNGGRRVPRTRAANCSS
jgi:alkylation response protein AidB-like acyl-CoA dehydrogenase